MLAADALPPEELEPSPRRARQVNRLLGTVFVVMLAIGIVPLLSWVQYTFVPVLTEFEITEVERVGESYTMRVRLPDGSEDTRTVGAGLLLHGEMVKSRIYPKWACAFKSIDAAERTASGRWRRTTISYGINDQPEGHGTTRMAGAQSWGPWHVRLNSSPTDARTLHVRFDKRHLCFKFWPTLQRSDRTFLTLGNGGARALPPERPMTERQSPSLHEPPAR